MGSPVLSARRNPRSGTRLLAVTGASKVEVLSVSRAEACRRIRKSLSERPGPADSLRAGPEQVFQQCRVNSTASTGRSNVERPQAAPQADSWVSSCQSVEWQEIALSYSSALVYRLPSAGIKLLPEHRSLRSIVMLFDPIRGA